jgi:hypothetical protein
VFLISASDSFFPDVGGELEDFANCAVENYGFQSSPAMTAAQRLFVSPDVDLRMLDEENKPLHCPLVALNSRTRYSRTLALLRDAREGQPSLTLLRS